MSRANVIKGAVIVAGVVVLLVVVWAMVAWRHPKKSPIEFVEVTEPNFAMDEGNLPNVPPTYFRRLLVIRFRELSRTQLIYGFGSYEIREGGQWSRGPGIGSPKPEPQIAPGGGRANRLLFFAAADADRMRVTVRYFPRGPSWMPFGIGVLNSRNANSSPPTVLLRRTVKAISPKLFDVLWPVMPSRSSTNGWKCATLEFEVPVLTNGVERHAEISGPPALDYFFTNAATPGQGIAATLSNLIVTQRLAMLTIYSNNLEARKRMAQEMYEQIRAMTNRVSPISTKPLAAPGGN